MTDLDGQHTVPPADPIVPHPPVTADGANGRRVAELRELITTMRDDAAALAAGVSVPPRAIRLRAGEVSVELEWHAIAPPRNGTADGAPAPITASVPADDPGAAVPAGVTVAAPVVGVFYRSPEPGAAPFVSEGDRVTRGQQVGIVEAMKLMIPVQSGHDGVVVSVLATDGESVEYDQPLLVLDPGGS